jgi:hypothetical protein
MSTNRYTFTPEQDGVCAHMKECVEGEWVEYAHAKRIIDQLLKIIHKERELKEGMLNHKLDEFE